MLCGSDVNLSQLPWKQSVNLATRAEAVGEWFALRKSKKEPRFTSKTLWATESACKGTGDHDREEAASGSVAETPRHSLCSKLVWLQWDVSAGLQVLGPRGWKTATSAASLPVGTRDMKVQALTVARRAVTSEGRKKNALSGLPSPTVPGEKDLHSFHSSDRLT